MLFLLSTIVHAEVQTIWLKQSTLDDPSFPSSIALGFLEQKQRGALLFDIDSSDLKRLQELQLPYRLETPNRAVPSGYRDTEDAITFMEDFAQTYPDIATLHNIGTSVQGRPILGLQIRDTDDPINSWKILGTHHGDELSASETSLDFIQFIDDNINTPELDTWLQSNELWIIPHVNPDGIESVSRYNANYVDLNRNYDWEWTSEEFLSGDHAFSEPETQAIRILEEWTSFTGGLSLHAGAANISWVWNYTIAPVIDAQLVYSLAEEYDAHCDQPDFYIVNGAEWYITYGDTTDWSYGAQGSFDLTLEVSEDKRPPIHQMAQISEYHIPAIWNFLQWEHWISAKIYDSETGKPIRAEWQLLEDGHLDRGDVSGRVSRLVESNGLWSLEVSAAGYQSQVLSIESNRPAEIYLEKEPDFQPITCTMQEASQVDLSFDEEFSEVALWKQGAEILVLEEQSGSWQASSPTLLSGVYDLQTDQGWRRNALVLVDKLEVSGSQSDDNLWLIENSVLQSTPSTAISEQCVFQIRQGKLIGLLPPESEPSAEPSTEPSEDVLDDTVDEYERRKIKAGCQQMQSSRTTGLLSMILLSMLSMIRRRI